MNSVDQGLSSSAASALEVRRLLDENARLRSLLIAHSIRESQALVAVHRDHHIALLEKFEAIERTISAGPMTDEQKVYMRTTLSYGQAVSRALIQWSDATEKSLGTLASSLLDS